jgi:protein-tyrosine-phosphatase
MSQSRLIAFVCLHGAAKSLVAAEFCKRLGAKNGLSLEATTSGPEPDPEIPAVVVAGLGADGIDVSGRRPERVSRQDLAKASHIVSFGLDLAGLAPKGVAIERWDDCPAVTEDYAKARTYIVTRVQDLVERLGAGTAGRTP